MGVGPLDQGGRRQFWGEGVTSSRRVPLIPNLIAGYHPASQQV
jgi:hypothetical protein